MPAMEKSRLVFRMRSSLRKRGNILKLPEGVTWLGHQPKPRVRELMSQADVLVLPSIEDGFGMVILQALACGCPVIASSNTGGPDVIVPGQTGFIVPANDDDCLLGTL